MQVGAQAALEFAERFNRLPVADQETQVNVVLAAHLTHQTFLHAMYARLGLGDAFDALAQGIEAVFIHDVSQRRAENAPGVVSDDGGSGERRPIVRAFPALTHDERNADAEEGGEGSQRVAAVVPGFCFERAARGFAAFALIVAVEAFLHAHHGDEGERRRILVRGDDVGDAFVSDDARRGEEEGDCQESGERFGAAVTVGMVGIRRLVGDAQAEIEQQRGEYVGGGFNGVGNQRVRMAENPGDAFNQREGGVAEDAKEDDFRGRCLVRRGWGGHGMLWSKRARILPQLRCGGVWDLWFGVEANDF